MFYCMLVELFKGAKLLLQGPINSSLRIIISIKIELTPNKHQGKVEAKIITYLLNSKQVTIYKDLSRETQTSMK